MTMLPQVFFVFPLHFWFLRHNRFCVICRAHQPFFLSVLEFASGDPLQVRGLQVVLTHRAGSTRLPLMIQFHCLLLQQELEKRCERHFN